MPTLKKVNQVLFRRTPDECFTSLDDLHWFCRNERDNSEDFWERSERIALTPTMTALLNDSTECSLNEWSFSQLCRMADVSKETINRLHAETARSVFEETLPRSGELFQLLKTNRTIRSIHGAAFPRLWNAELLDTVRSVAPEYSPPHVAIDGTNTGLYCGEQDMFAFFIDPTRWIEIADQSFALGFFVWNSEVGRRTLGVQTFWYQQASRSHIVWDPISVVKCSCEPAADRHERLAAIGRQIQSLVAQADRRRDTFATILQKANHVRLGADVEEVTKTLDGFGLPKRIIEEGLKNARQNSGFTLFSIVDAFARLSQSLLYAGDRAELDGKIGALLAIAV